jgi:alanine racemase
MSAQCSPPPAGAHREHPAPSAGAAFAPEAAPDDAARSRAWVDVDLAALVRNARRVRAHAGVPLVPMVKAEAYGLGAVAVARALVALGERAVWGLGVASVDEGAALRAAGIDARVVIFTPLVRDDLPRAARAGLTPSLHRADDVRRWAALGGGAWHLAIDTGMARAGVRWDAIDAALLDAVRAHPPEGAYTHLHSAERADGTAAEQQARFRGAVDRLPARPRLLHAENSPAVAGGGPSAWELVRPGLYLYGASCARDAEPAAAADADPAGGGVLGPPEPVAHLRARVVDVRELGGGEPVSYGATWRAPGPRRIATVALGYADGYRRALSNRGVALVGGREAPVVGRVTMDMTMLDVTDAPCAVGDAATLLGRDGDRVLTVDAVADRGELSSYELLAGLRLRVPHVYIGE